jgi:glycosyltransferase involved in cell wall biosynthesis
MKRIAFNLLGRPGWQAGFVYLTNLFHALQMANQTEEFFPLVILPEDGSMPQELKEFFHEWIRFPAFKRLTVPWFLDQTAKKIFRYDFNRCRFLSRHQIRLIAFGEAPQGSKIPWLYWLPDFQHIHLPEMFSKEEYEWRNHYFMRRAKAATRIVLLSESVKRDYQSFAPSYAYKARVIVPISYIPPKIYEIIPKSIADIYSLPDRFIYFPNQFWRHKNHEAVFRAVRRLKDQGLEVFIVCSGDLTDFRHPNYFSELLQLASRLGIFRQILFLGLIPREHVFALIRQSICVLNPSLFEGFGLTTDEARSVGKQTLLSDISAHREQNPPGAIFFNPNDEQDLASKLKLVWSQQSPGPDSKLEAEARETLPSRLRLFGESFMSLLHEVVT